MDNIRLTLEYIFCKYPYDQLVKHTKEKFFAGSYNPVDKDTFIQNIQCSSSLYTYNNLELLYNLYQSRWLIYPEQNRPINDREKQQKNIFHALLHFTNPILKVDNGRTVVRFEQLFRWRELSYIVGEDLLICSFLAYQDCNTFIQRKKFSWPMVCINDDINLQALVQEKFAELHFHLKGSSNNFEISWICLMNHITQRSSDFKELDKHISYGIVPERNMLFSSLYHLCIDAAKLRLELFRFLNEANYSIKWKDTPFPLPETAYKLQSDINIERFYCNSFIEGYCYDYAITPGCCKKNRILDVFSGERQLLYSLFKYIYDSRDTNGWITLLFYRYLLAKAQLREELVQINTQSGFGNFAKYESRKDIFVEQYEPYKRLIPRIAIYESVHSHGVDYIEARITPKKDAAELQSTLHSLDHMITSSDIPKTHFSYICHFIKKRDSFIPQLSDIRERHRELRLTIRQQVQALMRLREISPSTASRIIALDAANNELFCRAEVFAQAYRYVRLHMKKKWPPVSPDTVTLPELKFTFHVGEEFTDITDGLRAIDEAINFLELQHGDRLGHCLALGVDPIAYYQSGHVIMSRHCFLDNIVWLHHKLTHPVSTYTSEITPFLEEMYEKLYRQIYGSKYTELPSMLTYYHAMRLRGDDPWAYQNYNEITKSSRIVDWNAASLDVQPEAEESRQDRNARILYYRYHFDYEVRIHGEETDSFLLPGCYAEIIKDIQNKMIDDLTNRQIIIECCPTSNLKIGPFERYENHPIFRFYNTGLKSEPQHQLQVTVNTDDQGIFATSLDNEYALLALALLKKKEPYHTREQVFHWLKKVYHNGHTYKFRKE